MKQEVLIATPKYNEPFQIFLTTLYIAMGRFRRYIEDFSHK